MFRGILGEEGSTFFYITNDSVVEFTSTRYLLTVGAQIINGFWKVQPYSCRLRAIKHEGLVANGDSLPC